MRVTTEHTKTLYDDNNRLVCEWDYEKKELNVYSSDLSQDQIEGIIEFLKEFVKANHES